MKNASNSTFDSRPPIFGRKITSVFPKIFSIPHQSTGTIKAGLIVPMLAAEILVNLPALLFLRFYLKKHKSKKNKIFRVAYFADCLDEVNGIANNLREVTSYMRSTGKQASLIGCAFHTRTRGIIENSYVFLLPRFFSMEAYGYSSTELALPHFGQLAKLLMRYPISLLEIETPSAGGIAIAIAAHIAGIKVISHYRTDATGYVRMLVPAKWIHTAVLYFIRLFCKVTRPIVVPCESYKKILQNELKVPEKDIAILPRGIALSSYNPSYRGKGTWENIFHTVKKNARFLYVGRISKEKDLPFLEEVWHDFHKMHPNAELAFAGDGWYLEILKKNFKEEENVFFAGNRGGSELAGLYADADYFVFPSGTDTFGNVVVEALASGTPAIVTDKGGPQDIIRNHDCGYILPFRDKASWIETFGKCVQGIATEEYSAMRENAKIRSTDFTLDKSANAQWKFFENICGYKE